MQHKFSYLITDTENLIFSGVENKFELFSKGEGSNIQLIARFEGGKWNFENDQQRKLFLALFDNNRKGFFKAIKAFQRSLKERPKLYEFTCIRRRVSIKVTKLKRNFRDKLQEIFYPYQPRVTYTPEIQPEVKTEKKTVKKKTKSTIDTSSSIKEMD